MKFTQKILLVGLIITTMNVIAAIMLKNYYAMMGWIVALCYFPYEEAFKR